MDLLEAISQNNIKQVKNVLEINRLTNINETIRNQQGQNITTPLVRACQVACKVGAKNNSTTTTVKSNKQNDGSSCDTEVIELLFQHKVDVNKQTQCADGLTPLYVACEGGNRALVRLLLDKGAYVDTQIRLEKMSPLHVSIRNGHWKIVDMLIECEADINIVSNTGTPLYEAVAQGTTQVAKMLLDLDADANKTSSKTNETALHKSVAMDYVSMTRLLVESGADPSIKMHGNSYTALCVAVEQKNVNCLQYLLNLPYVEVDVEVAGDRRTPLGVAAQCDSAEMTKLLIQAGADIDYLSLRKTEENDTETNFENQSEIRNSTLKGGDVGRAEQSATTSLTPLMIACLHGHRRVVELLLEKGASTNIQNQEGNTALHYALFKDNTLAENGNNKDEKKISKLCGMLLKKRANPNTQNNNGVSPFYYAVRHRMLFILEAFLKSGANANAADQNESCALHHLADCAPSYNLLAKYRADASKQNADGRSPLHIAAASYETTQEDMESLLAEFTDVDLTAPNYDGEMVVHVAKKMEILEFFRRQDEAALISATTWSGDTLLHCMIKNRFQAADIKKALKWKCFDTDAVNCDEVTALDLSKAMLNSEVFRILDEEKRERNAIAR